MTSPATDAVTTASTPAPVTADSGTSRRPPMTLQRRLILTIIGIVSFILVVVAIVTSVMLGSVLQRQLDDEIRAAAADAGRGLDPPLFPGTSEGEPDAYAVLAGGRQQPGFLLVLQTPDGSSGAVVTGIDSVTELSATQVDEILGATSAGGFTSAGLGADLGAYRLVPIISPNTGYTGVVGLPLDEVQSTIGEILTIIALVTTAGLLVLVLATAWTIRSGLKPLRAVADTAARVAQQPLDQGAVSITERVPAAQSDDRTEIGRVGAALNTLLDHVESSLDARQRNEERMRTFVADASHELRTPLASIRGYSELSLRDRTLSENSAQALERIQAQSVRMTGIVEDLLLLARLDEGQELVYGTSDISRLVVEAVGDAQAAGPDHEWQLDVGDEPVLIAGDTARLHQVVANLLANARTHTPAGTTVTASVVREGDTAIVRVHDDGPGVDPGLQAELFERFARADRSRARQTGGSGLGLSIARAIVEAHRGEIAVRSVPGDTTFEVRLPAKPRDPGV
jgi:two-component system OmpR family sensor kinase